MRRSVSHRHRSPIGKSGALERIKKSRYRYRACAPPASLPQPLQPEKAVEICLIFTVMYLEIRPFHHMPGAL